jgi:hypothetical protein
MTNIVASLSQLIEYIARAPYPLSICTYEMMAKSSSSSSQTGQTAPHTCCLQMVESPPTNQPLSLESNRANYLTITDSYRDRLKAQDAVASTVERVLWSSDGEQANYRALSLCEQ